MCLDSDFDPSEDSSRRATGSRKYQASGDSTRVVDLESLSRRVSVAVVVAAFVVAVAGTGDWLAGRPSLSDPLVVGAVAAGFVIAAVGPSVQTVVRRRS